jgi:hypothetical protein
MSTAAVTVRINAPETHLEYAQRVGEPRTGACRIELATARPWGCLTHTYLWGERATLLDGRLDDRCPMARLEEWRAKRWAAAA